MSEVLVRFAHISDTHIEPEEGAAARRLASAERIKQATMLPDFVREAIIAHETAHATGEMPYSTAVQAATVLIETLNTLKTPIDFVLHTGDVVNHGEATEYAETLAIFDRLTYPVYYACGNHDNVTNLKSGLLDQTPDAAALDYTFAINGVQFVCVDSATNGEGINWQVTADQLAWLEAQITGDDDRPLIVAIHHPPFQCGVDWLDYFIVRNWQEIQAVLEKAGPRLRGVFSGHIHIPIDCYRNGVLYSVVPEVFSHEPGYSIVTVTADDILIERMNF